MPERFQADRFCRRPIAPDILGFVLLMSAILVLMMFSPALGADEFLSRKNEVVASILQGGWADSSEQEMLLRYAKDCFSWNPVDTSSGVGGLQGSLGDATQCVLINLEQRWGWKPELTGSGSNNGGPYDAYGASNAVIGVDTPSGKWQFILKKSGGGDGDDTTSHQTVSANCLHRGDATVEQETDLISFTEQCFQKNPIDISNVGSLQGSIGSAVGCVLQKCEEKWGWKPTSTGSGSNTGGPYDAYGLGATIMGAETSTGKWQFILRLKF